MKLNLALVISLIIAMPIQAGYMVKIPLENYQGGTLPDGSIKIGNGTPENNTEPEVDPASCKYDENNYYFEAFDSNNVITGIDKTYNGYDMFLPASKGKLVDKDDAAGWREYEICYTVPETEQWVSVHTIYEWTEDYCPERIIPTTEISTEIANIPLIDYDYYTVQAIDEYGEDVTVRSYEKYIYIPEKCNTKERNVTEYKQNTVTLEIIENQYSEIISVPEYETGDTITVSCDYQRLKDTTNNYMYKWVVNGSNATYYYFTYIHPSSSTLIDSSRFATGAGYWGRGTLVETIGSEQNYAVCNWGGTLR